MWKVRGFIILAVLLWLAGALGYRGAAAEKLRSSMAKQYGPGVVVEKVDYRENYGLSEWRHGEAIFSVPAPKEDPRNPRGFATQKLLIDVETRGRWWPEELRHGYPKPLQTEKSTD